MAGLETVLAATGGVVLGAGVAALWHRNRDTELRRQTLAAAARIRRRVVPVLERRADQLSIPVARRGRDQVDPLAVASALAQAIDEAEQGADLPFKDTLEVPRDSLQQHLGPPSGKEPR